MPMEGRPNKLPFSPRRGSLASLHRQELEGFALSGTETGGSGTLVVAFTHFRVNPSKLDLGVNKRWTPKLAVFLLAPRQYSPGSLALSLQRGARLLVGGLVGAGAGTQPHNSSPHTPPYPASKSFTVSVCPLDAASIKGVSCVLVTALGSLWASRSCKPILGSRTANRGYLPRIRK